MSIDIFSYSRPGVDMVYDKDNRVIGLKNYSSANNLLNIATMERHLQTDEQFLLFEGSCIIITLKEVDRKDLWTLTSMQAGIVYSIPRGLWHLTVMTPGTRMVLIENSGTTVENSERFKLSDEQIAGIMDKLSEM